jgi:hypothetical protein
MSPEIGPIAESNAANLSLVSIETKRQSNLQSVFSNVFPKTVRLDSTECIGKTVHAIPERRRAPKEVRHHNKDAMGSKAITDQLVSSRVDAKDVREHQETLGTRGITREVCLEP